MGDDIGSGLSSMSVCFDFRSTNVVQLSNWNPYFYRFRCHHPLITQLNPSSCQYPLVNYHNLDDDIDDHQTILARSLEELQHKLNRMEQELIIVGEESKELQLRLGQREDDLTKKVRFKGPYFNYVSICLPIFDQVSTLS